MTHAPPRNPAQPGSSPTRMAALIGMVAVINLFLLATVAATLYQSRLQAHQRAAAAAQNLALALERELEGEIGHIDTALLWSKEVVERPGLGGTQRRNDIEAFIKRQTARVPFLDGIQVVDVEGVFTQGIGVEQGRIISIKDRDYFRKLRDDTNEPFVVSNPLLGRLTHEWAVIMGRRLDGPGGAFAGAVLANVNLTRFTRTLSSLNVDRHGIVVLRGEDLASIARFPSLPGDTFKQVGMAASPELEAEVRAGHTHGSYYTTRNAQGIPRMASFRKVLGYPFYVVVGLGAQDYLAPWRKEAFQAAVLSTAFLLLTALSAWLLWTSWERDRMAQARMIQERERQRNEKALLELEAQVRQAQKMDSLGVLAGGVAHDMNNVLGAILALATAHLSIQGRDNPVYPALETIRDAATRGGDMVKRLLTFARQAPGVRQALNLNALIMEEIRLLERTVLARIRLETDLAADLRPIHGDGSALAHAVMNLCVNAVDAMEGGGTLTLVTRNAGPDQVEVLVQDTGCGMAREVLERAMDPFFTTKEVGKGTGLGLSMVYATVKAHGGRLDLQSEPGRGTRVRLSFPALAARELRPAPAPDPVPATRAPALDVLLVDDDDLIRTSSRMLLAALGHTLTAVTSGEEALALLAEGARPDVVILDMNMPGLGGKGTLPRLRSLCPDVPVLLATGRADQEALDLTRAHPGVTLLGKPFGMDELRGYLGRLGAPGLTKA